MDLKRIPLLMLVFLAAALLWPAAGFTGSLPGEGWLVSALEGQVQIRTGEGTYRSAVVGDRLGPSAALATGEGGRALLFHPDGAALRVGSDSLLECGTSDGPAAGSPWRCLSLASGKVQYAIDLSTIQAKAGIILATRAAKATIVRGAGLLDSAAVDRWINIEGGPISVMNRHTGENKVLRPGQAAMIVKDGRVNVSEYSPEELDRCMADTQINLALPPAHLLKPSQPVNTPLTMAERVRKPWPVLPPVVQSPNIWIHEKAFNKGRVIRRPIPRR